MYVVQLCYMCVVMNGECIVETSVGPGAAVSDGLASRVIFAADRAAVGHRRDRVDDR